MTAFTLSRHEDPRALAALEAHIAACPTCGPASSHRTACQTGRVLHEHLVTGAVHDRRRTGRPWWQTLDLAEVGERHLGDFLGERALELSQIEGVDISVWQGSFPFDEAIAAGVRWCVAKASEGDGFTDPRWGENLAALLAPGPIVGGSYHFARPDLGNSPVAEAGWYLSRHPAACFSPSVPWIFALDAESAGGSAAHCYGFLDTVCSRIGYSCWFYSYLSWIQSRAVQAFNRPLWMAWPNPGAVPNAGWPAITAQQYGSRGMSVGQVDADRFFGPMSVLLELAGASVQPPPAPVPAPPPPAPPPPPVTEDPDMGDIAYLSMQAQLGQQHIFWTDAKGNLLQRWYDGKSWSGPAVIATGLAPRTPVTVVAVDDLKQIQLVARLADGTILHAIAPYGAGFATEVHGTPDGGLPVPGVDIAALVAGLAAALAPHLQVLDQAKLEADLLAALEAGLPPLDAAASMAAFRGALGK